MYSICNTIHPATSVEHSIECHFYNLQETNLLVAGGDKLTIYKITQKPHVKLEQKQSYELHGSVASLTKICLGNRQTRRRDSIVLSFNDAKLSIVEYDPETHDLKTISMHYFEDDKLRGGSVTNHLHFPLVRVDPENRCVAMLIYGKHIIVIPIDKEEEDDLDDELYNSESDEEGDVTVQPDSEQNVLPSYIIDLSEQSCGQRIENICDIQFLHNYNDPTLALLYEPTRTWSGRVASRQDTFSLVALSMNLQQKIQPIIWKVNDLPYDCLRILPVPKPISGLLIIACNEIMYLNQSVPPFGMSFNTFSKESTMFPLKEPPIVEMEVDEEPQAQKNQEQENDSEEKQTEIEDTQVEDEEQQPQQEETQNQADDTCDSTATNTEPKIREKKKHYINISLDLSQAVFLDYNKILFILKDGDVYLVTLSNDDMRSIKEFRFQLIDSTVQPNCVTLCQNNILFIGSHVGDSVLAEIIGDLQDMTDDLDDIYNETTTTTAITNNINNHNDTTSGSDLDMPLVNGNNKEPIRLCERDKLISSSASGGLCYGEAPYLIDNSSYDYNKDQNIEFVMTAGLHKSGAICVLQRTIKPTILDTYELKDCAYLWTLKPSASSNAKHSRLLLNRDQETMIFTTNNELLELKQTERAFENTEPTIMASNVGPDDLTLQVMSFGAKLISDDKTVHSVQFESKVYDACIADSHVIALKADDSLYHLEINSTSDGYGIALRDIAPLTDGKVVSISLYKDLSGIFTCSEIGQSNHQATGPSRGSSNHGGQSNQVQPTYWVFLLDERGVLEIFSVPDFRSVYSVDNFPSMPIILADNIKSFIRDLDLTVAKTQEILMCGLGRDKSRGLLLVRSDIELVIYEAYSYTDFELNTHLKIRFRKLNSILMTTLAPPMQVNGMIDQPDTYRDSTPRAIMAPNHHDHDRRRKKSSKSTRDRNYYRQRLRDRFIRGKHWLVPFDGVGGYSGIFVSGFKPHWLFMTDFGALRLHPMNLDGPVYSFAPYNDNNFIYYTANQELKIASLPNYTNLDNDWPIRKLYMNETVHFVNYHVERKVYCVVTSSPSPCSKIMKVGSEPDTMKVEDLERDGNYIHPTTEKFTLQLYDPEKWELIPDCKIEFEEWEQVTCVKNVLLTSEGTKSGLKGYIAVSTNYCYGEDVPNRGRILILDLIEVVPEPDRPLTKNKIKKVYCEEQKGPVTTLSHVCGLLLSAVGQKIYLWQLKEERLDGVAFIDTQIYINCATSVKNLVLVSDVCKSLSLLRYQQETRTLSMVCRDPKPLEVFACDFVVDNESLNFVCTDSEKNILIYSHDPENEDSYGGTRLIRRADYHLGSHVTCLCRLRGKVPSCLENAGQNEIVTTRRRHLNLFCTVDGAIGYLYPIDESMFKRLQQLQSEMTVALPHAAGLNPKAWRLIKQARPGIAMPCKQILDGNLLNRFMALSSKERNELTKKIGSSTDVILADLQYIQESALHF